MRGSLFGGLFAVFVVFLLATDPAAGEDKAAIYGAIPDVSDAQISPDGKTIAMLRTVGETTSVVFYEIDRPDQKPFGVSLKSGEARDLTWADNDHVLMLASDLGRMQTVNGLTDIEFFRWFAVSKSKAKPIVLFGNEGGYYMSSSGALLSTLPHDDGTALFARWSVYGGSYDVFRVNLDTSRADMEEGGRQDTYDWIASKTGEIIARVDYNNSRQVRIVYTRGGEGEPFRKVKEYPEGRGDPAAIVLYGETGGGDLLGSILGESRTRSMIELSRDSGEHLNTVYENADFDIDQVIYDFGDATAIGIRYIDDLPRSVFFDPEQNALQKSLERAVGGASPIIVSWSDDRSRMIIKTVYPDHPPQYFLYDQTKKSLSLVAVSYPSLDGEVVAKKERFDYVSGDGLETRGYLTVPAAASKTNMPLIVMPHGGPQGRDDMTYDWWSFYYAANGYLTYQPNFRGSDGYGRDFLEAGFGEWGRKMQDDITEGVQKLIDGGYVDPSRVCIVGASYGGYAALAGATLTPELYACAVSVNGVSDLPALLGRTVRAWGIPEEYWEIRVGSRFRDEEALDAVSPVHLADKAGPPIMLIHSRDDIVVPYSHAIRMHDALKEAGKPVELVQLKGEDHWLSRGKTRTEMLSRSLAFIERHIGSGAPETAAN